MLNSRIIFLFYSNIFSLLAIFVHVPIFSEVCVESCHSDHHLSLTRIEVARQVEQVHEVVSVADTCYNTSR